MMIFFWAFWLTNFQKFMIFHLNRHNFGKICLPWLWVNILNRIDMLITMYLGLLLKLLPFFIYIKWNTSIFNLFWWTSAYRFFNAQIFCDFRLLNFHSFQCSSYIFSLVAIIIHSSNILYIGNIVYNMIFYEN